MWPWCWPSTDLEPSAARRYHANLHVDLIQQYGVAEEVAKHLAKVCHVAPRDCYMCQRACGECLSVCGTRRRTEALHTTC